MQTSAARVQANQANAQRSTGPKTVEGKERSRANAFKHGQTGSGIVLPEADSAEVERRAAAFSDELMANGELGQALARRAALNSVRMERAADQQTAALSQRVRQVEADFVAPDGVDDDEAAILRAEAVRISMFDPSREATLARRYEAAAERNFFKAIKELRQLNRQADSLATADPVADFGAPLGSFGPTSSAVREPKPRDPEPVAPTPRPSTNSAYFPPMNHEVDVPMTIGRAR